MQNGLTVFDFTNTTKRVIALGFFDGVHLGHQTLLRRAVKLAGQHGLTPAVFTFDRIPKEFITGKPVQLLTTVDERINIIQTLFPIPEVIVEPFDNRMMLTPPQEFFAMLRDKYHAGWLVAGADYTFGYKNAGTATELAEMCRKSGIGCDIIPYVLSDELRISSTRIRQLLAEGREEEADKLLGHPLPFLARQQTTL